MVNVLVLAAGIAALTSALDRGDLDEVARKGALAGPVVVEKALGGTTRSQVLAGIVSAPGVEDRAELLPALARIAAGPDRRTAIPAARAAAAIARELAHHDLPDDLAPDDLATWRAQWSTLALSSDHFVEVRVHSLDVASALARVIDPRELGFDRALLTDPDPDVRAVATALAP
ncbi:MAG: hypothetical protein JWO36_1822 [Myxococcales bacterium]|nr:hypothetical protein [Myxococcales bacterium]